MSSLLVTCRNKSSVDRHYVPAIRKGGWEGRVVLVNPEDPAPSLEGFSGLLLTGGDDIHPRRWDPAEAVHAKATPDEARDALEIPLALRAWEMGLPILGICRGEQLLNVALGGSLVQDIPCRCGTEPGLHQLGSSNLPPQLAHRVEVDPASRLGGLVGPGPVRVNSRHHQAVARLSPLLKAVAWHPETLLDGHPLVEGVEAADPSRWAVAVQWHPENLVDLEGGAGASALGIFRGFAAVLRERA